MAERALFTGGPCDGEEHPLSAAEINTGRTSCNGVIYYLAKTNVAGLYTATAAAGSTPGGTFQQYAPDLWAGYQDLKRSIAKRLRPAVTQAQRNNQLALRALARRSKVKGRR